MIRDGLPEKTQLKTITIAFDAAKTARNIGNLEILVAKGLNWLVRKAKNKRERDSVASRLLRECIAASDRSRVRVRMTARRAEHGSDGKHRHLRVILSLAMHAAMHSQSTLTH